ncbi:MAG: hypothetical protein A2X34_02010 [Elusimicrobia bacterium GWC2_51_8]|nr:MAG: hypothetical protein A2X33_01420 [Elusimicrobia bacterium GWA2_51_34]OGR59197.1 MAG: hypothetical protein A2X34_02010 [Elusimicrobia bacterium GWC2_51_8]OGR86393.1 MAG: hypothetical protein A2021_07255 [Elusimicrobia bacterium GWF2_52_66]HAF96187.1 hypothetical protein [Elusimicrobiota bacterium]HCE97798.1 hypothetical protein [Elusimicrobiota bacterium]
MKGYRVFTLSLALLSGFFILTLHLSSQWADKLIIYPAGRDLPRFQSSDEEEEDSAQEGQEETEEEEESPRPSRKEKGTAQRIRHENGTLDARYNFINFNRDRLTISFSITEKDYRTYLAGYGYSETELSNLTQWRNATRQKEWAKAVAKGGEAAGKEALTAVEWEYKVRLNELFRSRGLELLPGNIIICDIPAIVKRNIPFLKPMALAFQKISEARGYGPEETVGAALSMAQTALRYKIPPMIEGSLHTGGLLPPGRALLSGWGDCDTKTALVASILGNWSGMRLVGISVPDHYLMAIRRIPAKGDLFVRYDGLEYVLIEPAGPAWLEPGAVGTATSALLQGSEGYKIEPFF